MNYIKNIYLVNGINNHFHYQHHHHHHSQHHHQNPNYQQLNSNKIFYLLVMLLTLMINLQDKLTLACPSDVCICKWKGGKQTVECGGQMLSKIPEGMDPGTQVLNFSGNLLQVLQSERFLRMDLINLQKIYLSRNQLIKIHEKAFRGLSNLVELDLSDNMLQHIPTETFQDYTSLMRLSLSGNPIRELKTASFRHLSFLTTLELSNCHIERIENEAFIGMDNLEWLRLDGNRIQYIQGAHVLPKSLHGISLQSNRWQCDCRLIDIHAWLVNYNTPQTEEPRCLEPIRLKGQQIKSLKKDELACLPEVQPKSTYTEVAEGRNISIQCTVRAIPEPKVLWLFNGQVLTNETIMDNLHMYYYIDEGTGSAGEEKRSEVFIYNVGPEDNGTFSCIGQNTAGTTFSNYTLRVIIKEPPVVKEVSFAKDYMNYIMISGGGAGCLFVLLVCTIALKCSCRSKQPSRSTKNIKQDTSSNEIGLLKCPSIINEEDMSPKSTKENGIILAGGNCSIGHPSSLGISNGASGQMKQGFMMYVPSLQQGHIMDNASMQINESSAPTPPLVDTAFEGIALQGQYCSPPGSVMRNYADKNPDLVNDAESVKNKFVKQDSEYDGSECSAATAPCNLQNAGGGTSIGPGIATTLQSSQNFEYQLANQFGSQIIRPQSGQRIAAMSTLPRGMHLKSLSNNSVGGGQHQVDVHLNPVCFLSQDGSGYASYEISNNSPNMQNAIQQQQQQQQQQQNFYRTLPHNRGGHNNKFNVSAANPGTRYSLEAEFLQRSNNGTQPSSPYDKYTVPSMRFTAEGYPIHQQQQQHPAAAIAAIVQYPSPPEGYKGGIVDYKESGQTLCPVTSASFQQWPPCLPGYHVQPIRYTTAPIVVPSPTTNLYGSNSSVNSSTQQQQSSQTIQSSVLGTSINSNNINSSNNNISGSSNNSSSSSTQTPSSNSIGINEVKKRCVGAQTTELEPSTIPECDEEQELLQSTTTGASSMHSHQSTSSSSSKLRHLNGPLADSPDEGYVGDSQDTCSDI
ncbi:uncharacterized protein LOC129615149 [Condylostylus longicornis]|uniref:uncharacterized protein LOC129615149 n=1 Tax=Condylostylus longicornis TaxID=2530218 RepID=UPI00244DE51D|nr:uncharacterized protein LOC129615149 [Condylostylus longicornis]